jgi:cell division protein FtsB
VSTPRRPTAGRRPGRPAARATRSTTTRAVTRPAPAVAGRQKRDPGQPRRSPLTPRTAVLALVAAGLLASAALPMREYVNQRREIAELEQAQALTRDRVAELEAEKQRLQDPVYIAAEARRRLHFVLPGETAYVVLAPETPAVEEGAEGPASPWYTQLWGSVQEADRPEPPKR